MYLNSIFRASFVIYDHNNILIEMQDVNLLTYKTIVTIIDMLGKTVLISIGIVVFFIYITNFEVVFITVVVSDCSSWKLGDFVSCRYFLL